MTRLPRSYLFVPADRSDRIDKAWASGADAVIVDLEDAVAEANKGAARDALANALRAERPVLVRINAAGTRWFDADAELMAHPGVAAVLLPKAETPDAVRAVRRRAGKPVLALIESALGMAQAPALAATEGVTRLVFGSIDFQLDLDIPEDDGQTLLWFRSQLVLASRLANLPAPVDGVSTALDDAECIQADATRSRSLGFGAKLCIHPKQVAWVNAAFSPSEQEVAWAQRIVAAAAAAQGAAVAVDGRMVDAPVLARARRLLLSAELA